MLNKLLKHLTDNHTNYLKPFSPKHSTLGGLTNHAVLSSTSWCCSLARISTSVTYPLNLRRLTFFSNLCETSSVSSEYFLWLGRTHISSISAGVRRANSGRMNQAMTVETVPVPAKLCKVFRVSLNQSSRPENISRMNSIQETGFNAPFSISVDHQWRAKAKHDANCVWKSKGPSCGLCTQALLRNFRSKSISDSRCACGWQGC